MCSRVIISVSTHLSAEVFDAGLYGGAFICLPLSYVCVLVGLMCPIIFVFDLSFILINDLHMPVLRKIKRRSENVYAN